jgi:hypothetical protein
MKLGRVKEAFEKTSKVSIATILNNDDTTTSA